MNKNTKEAAKPTHTPGPWTMQGMTGLCGAKNSLPIMAVNGFNGCGVEIASVHAIGDAKHANARLIAAAPDLLAALKAIVERSGGKLYNTDQITAETFYDLACAAILRATGDK